MALIVGDLLQSLQREAGDNPPDPILAVDWLQQRYESVLTRAPWPFLIKEAIVSTVAEITAGTVTVTNGSATVTETTSNANGWSSSVESRFFRRDGDSEFYKISTFGDANPDTLTLNRVYEGATGTVIGYTIFQRFYSLASDVREVMSIARVETPGFLTEVSQEELATVLPNRASLGNPSFWSYAGRDSSNNQQIELYRIPDEAHGFLYQYIEATPSLVDADVTILPQIPFGLLRSGWLADYWSWRSRHDNAPPNAGQHQQNQEREFEKRIHELLIRESPNFPPKRLKFHDRFWKHRILREQRSIPIRLP